MSTCAQCNRKLGVIQRHKCPDCARVFCGRHIYHYIDGNNGSITQNTKPRCAECYRKRWPS